MQLKEINPEKTPELFYAYQEEEGIWQETEQIEVPSGIRLRRKAKEGWQDIHYAPTGVVTLYHMTEVEGQRDLNEELITVTRMQPQYLVDEKWVDYDFKLVKSVVQLVDGEIRFHITDLDVTFIITQQWGIGKNQVLPSVEGKTKYKFRIVWETKTPVTVQDKLIARYDDYTKETSENEVTSDTEITKTVILSPKGEDSIGGTDAVFRS